VVKPKEIRPSAISQTKKVAHLFAYLAEGVGFEPTVTFQPRRFSRPVPSTARPPLQCHVLIMVLLIITRNRPPKCYRFAAAILALATIPAPPGPYGPKPKGAFNPNFDWLSCAHRSARSDHAMSEGSPVTLRPPLLSHHPNSGRHDNHSPSIAARRPAPPPVQEKVGIERPIVAGSGSDGPLIVRCGTARS
jgi:hypothetical protein